MIYLVGSRQLTAFLKNLQPGSESEHHSHDPVDNMNEAHFPQSNVVDAAFSGSVAHSQHLTYGPVFLPTYIFLRTFLALYLPSFLPSHTVLPPYLPSFVLSFLPSCKFLSFFPPYFLHYLSYLPSFCSPLTFVPSIIPAFVPPSYISSRSVEWHNPNKWL